jgi:osmoprotectant transport system permease protein
MFFLLGTISWSIGPDVIFQYKDDLIYYTGCHLTLVFWSMLLALLCNVPIGIILSRPCFSSTSENWMQIFNISNTIPSMAVLALVLPISGIGDKPAILALWLASSLPIVRNTYDGLKQTPLSMKEAAKGIGMKPLQVLFRVELPSAFPVIVGGIRTALVLNVGTAPLSVLVASDSLGGIIYPGILTRNTGQLLVGTVATALVALFLDTILLLCSNFYLSKRGVLR